MALYFTFEFSDSDFEGKGWERPITTFQFTVTPTIIYDSPEWHQWYDEVMLEKTGELESEEYGVHDFTGSSLNGNEYFGYYTYEVAHDKWDQLIMVWHQWFIDQGFNPGLIDLTIAEETDEG